MNGDSFESWFKKVLPLLEENAIIVIDNASYHSRKLEKIPTTAWRKEKIKEWLMSKNIECDDRMLKVQLLKLVAQHKSAYNAYVIDEMAKSENRIILRLPPYHCELNPIELIWADVKNYVASRNTSFKFSDVKNLFNDAILTITPEKWNKCVQHVVNKVELKFWELDNIVECMVEPLIIRVSDDSDSSDSDNWSLSE